MLVLGLCRKPIDPYIIPKLRTYKDLIDILSLPLNLIIKFLATIQFTPFWEWSLAKKNYSFFQKISFLIAKNTIFNGKKNGCTHFCRVDRDKQLCCRLWLLSLISSPFSIFDSVSLVALDPLSLILPCLSMSGKILWRETHYKCSARNQYFCPIHKFNPCFI
jgi:hypothetical protein